MYTDMLALMQEISLKHVSQYFAVVDEEQKLNCLKVMLSNLQIKQGIVFCNSSHAELLARKIAEDGFSCCFIASDMCQSHREGVASVFRNGFRQFLVAPEPLRHMRMKTVNVLINFDLPENSAAYLERVGRSGGFGPSLSIIIALQQDGYRLACMERELGTEIRPIPPAIDPVTYGGSQAWCAVGPGRGWL